MVKRLNVAKASNPCPRRRAYWDDESESQYQSFPSSGPLHDHLDLSFSALQKELASAREQGEVYVYVVSSVEWDKNRLGYVRQTGSAPNFQGGRVTLCTCKHQMRALIPANDWVGKWIAGFTRRRGDELHRLFYLMKVEWAVESHRELWDYLPTAVSHAKSYTASRLGDIFEPRSTPVECRQKPEMHFELSYYKKPHHRHSHDTSWQQARDLDYRTANQRYRPRRLAPLLLGDERYSFLWERPSLVYPHAINREEPAKLMSYLLDRIEEHRT